MLLTTSFDRTYEGLKHERGVPIVGESDEAFDRTYEGLKHDVGQVKAHHHRPFDRTYEGLKLAKVVQAPIPLGKLLTVPMRV